jgi:poly(beta-D-mannuronate) lyase
MVFKCPVDGFKTSANTSYTRVELREMLRGTNTSVSTQGVNKNNWVFGTAPTADKNAAAGYDGEMFATLAVNHVTTTGSNSHIGRLVIGQIHANNDEPIRVYYRKLKENTLGSIYFAHEPTDGNGSEQWYEIIGSRSNSDSNPSDGIALNEKFSYKIKVVGDSLTLTIIRDGKADVVKTINMVNSGFNVGGQYMYFKAGIYHLNNSGDADDYAQATFYALEKSHTVN